MDIEQVDTIYLDTVSYFEWRETNGNSRIGNLFSCKSSVFSKTIVAISSQFENFSNEIENFSKSNRDFFKTNKKF